MADRVLLIAPLSAIRKRTRLAKMVSVLVENNVSVEFLGWEREPGELDTFRWKDPRIHERIILRGGGYTSRKTRIMYFAWMPLVFWHVLRMGRSKVVFCLGWETAFPAYIASWFNGARIVFDDADRFSMVVGLPIPLVKVVQYLERWLSERSVVHLIPGWSRYDWHHKTMRVLQNTPSRSDVKSAHEIEIQKPSADLVVYVNGWIGRTRGAPVFLRVMDSLSRSNRKVVMLVAGRIDSPEGRKLIGLPNVKYYGEIPQVEALALYRVSDVVLTFYDPSVPINRLAESNKWGDCILFGTPFIVNEEVQTARRYVEAGAAWSVPYWDSDALAKLILELVENKERLKVAAEAMERLQREDPVCFDVAFERIMEDIGVLDKHQ